MLIGNAFASWLLIILFSVNQSWLRWLLILIVIILAVSSLLSFTLVHKKDNYFFRLYYIIATSWMGFILNLILSSIGGAIFWSFNVMSGKPLPGYLFRYAIIVIALALTIRAIFNAFKIRIKAEKVYITNLPAAWEGKRIVHISDVHLGPINRQKFFNKIINKIRDLAPDAVFITGDLFDGSEADFSWVKQPLDDLRAPLGLYYSFGNHDLYLGYQQVISLLRGENITILNNALVEKNGLQIIGINFSDDPRFNLKQIVTSKAGYNASKPSILLFHEPKYIPDAEGVGIDLQLSGHTHGGQMFPMNYLSKYFYKGFDHGLFHLSDYTLCVTAGVGTWGPPMRTASRSEIMFLTLKRKV